MLGMGIGGVGPRGNEAGPPGPLTSASGGDTVTGFTDADGKVWEIRAFLSSGNLIVPEPIGGIADILLVGAGAGGGRNQVGEGGSAGGVILLRDVYLAPGSYPVVIGGGGPAGGNNGLEYGSPGNPSSFGAFSVDGGDGGDGDGRRGGMNVRRWAGLSNASGTLSRFRAGTGGNYNIGNGGGGAGQAGDAGGEGHGGDGVDLSSLFGTQFGDNGWFGGGGGGGAWDGYSRGPGGAGGGGRGQSGTGASPVAGAMNSGGGGGGGGGNWGASGGSGVVLFRYPLS